MIKAEAHSGLEHEPKSQTPTERRQTLLAALGVDMTGLDPVNRAAMEAMAAELIDLRTERRDLQNRLELAESLADSDPLSAIFNRRAFERELIREIAQAERYGVPLSLIFIDLDNFKLINDRFGHQTGDDVIRHISDLLVSHLRQTDIVGRLGGDEFGVALTHTDGERALTKAKSLQTIIDRLEVFNSEEAGTEDSPVQLGASCGVVEWQAGMNGATFIAAGDEAMFRDKCRRKSAR